MAETGGKCERTETAKVNNYVSIHRQLTDAGQFSCAALCALGLQKLFEEEWNSQFNKDALSLILNGLEQPKQVHEAILAMYAGEGQDDMHPYVDVILKEEVLEKNATPVIKELIGIAVSQGNYDARLRVLIKHVAWRLHISWDHLEELECDMAETIIAQKYEMSQEEKAEQEKKAKHRKYKRAALIGLATVTGGTLIGLTGGLAAPLVAAGAGAIIGGAGAAALGSVAGVAIIGSLFGVAGAGLTGYKMKKRVGAIEEFEFEPLVSGGPLNLKSIRQQLHITIAVTGWLDNKMQDFKQPWKNLAESQEQYTLRWEPRYLKELGQALDYIFNTAVSMATNEALKYTVLSALMAAIAWPAALLSASHVIDNPWSVALQRAAATGRQLAEVLLSREQGKRPVTLIGYSLGGRVIFYCLEEMAKRKGCEGIIEDVVILGAPVSSDPKAWGSFQRVVAGRIINGYCRGDWLLKFLYRTASIQFHIAGLAPVKWTNHRMHNIDLSHVVSGHLDYMQQLDTILRVVGIRVRQQDKETQKIVQKPSGFLTTVRSKETSPEDSSSKPVQTLTNTAPATSDRHKSPSKISSPKEENVLSGGQYEEESKKKTSCNDDDRDKTVTSSENDAEVGVSQSGAGNHTADSAPASNIKSGVPNTSKVTDERRRDTDEKNDEEKSTEENQGAVVDVTKDAASKTERVGREKSKEQSEGKTADSSKQDGDVQAGLQKAGKPGLQDSDEDSYTSSNPDSSPEKDSPPDSLTPQ